MIIGPFVLFLASASIEARVELDGHLSKSTWDGAPLCSVKEGQATYRFHMSPYALLSFSYINNLSFRAA